MPLLTDTEAVVLYRYRKEIAMPPYFVLAQLYAEGSLPDLAHSALPGAPVQPVVEKQRRRRRVRVLWRARPWSPARRAVTAECLPANW
jgi:hypothetical protein